MYSRFGWSDDRTQPAAEKCCHREDGGADPEEKQRRDSSRYVLRGKEMSEDGIAAEDDAIDHDVTENDGRNRSEQLHARASRLQGQVEIRGDCRIARRLRWREEKNARAVTSSSGAGLGKGTAISLRRVPEFRCYIVV